MKMKKWTLAASAAALLGTLSAGSVMAFSDLDQNQSEPILALKAKGVVSGVDAEHFAPKNKISYAQSIHMLVKAFNLNIDNMKFVKKPEASDYFKNVPNNAWYAESFVIAHLNGVSIPQDVDPNGTITREQFAHFVMQALDTTGTYPLIKMYVAIEDEADITPEFNGSIQRMILHKFYDLGEDRKFYPKQELTRGEAAVWVHKAVSFVEKFKEETEKPPVQEEVQVTLEKVNDDVNKVILSRGQKPTSGYGIAVTGIRFTADGQAIIQYALTDPAPDSMNAQVITEPKAETYVSSKFKPVAEPDQNASLPIEPADASILPAPVEDAQILPAPVEDAHILPAPTDIKINPIR